MFKNLLLDIFSENKLSNISIKYINCRPTINITVANFIEVTFK